MKKYNRQFKIADKLLFKQKMLSWANQFSIFCFLDSCNEPGNEQGQEWKLAVGVVSAHAIDDAESFADFDEFLQKQDRQVFGHLSYDLRNVLANDSSPCADAFGFGYFFSPKILIELTDGTLSINAEGENIFEEIDQFSIPNPSKAQQSILQPVQDKGSYLESVKKIKEHIQAGDCYELNYCLKFIGKSAGFDAIASFIALTNYSPVPFAALYKKDGQYCVCASPERYIQKTGNAIISQPIKGTSKRYAGDELQDDMDKLALYESIKDRTENVMTVDLVRNDLSRVCEAGTVAVSELYGIYSFATVHQMISTVEGKLKSGITFTDILKATFPMGSMTGAPKKKVMELIEQYEFAGRGLFSGSIGYIDPRGDFDFNVVIRSIFYDEVNKKLWSFAGGAITNKSVVEDEWEECHVKLSAVKKIVEQWQKD